MLAAATSGSSLTLQGDPVQTLQKLLDEKRQYDGEKLWTELIDGLDPSYWLPNAPDTPENTDYRRLCTEASDCSLRIFSGDIAHDTQTQWRRWYEENSPGIVSQGEIAQLVLDRPDVINSAIARRIRPHRFGEIPEDCLPLYRRMLHSESPAVRYWSAQALLMYSDCVEPVPMLIELIAAAKPSGHPVFDSGPVSLLRNRFAVNFFRDVDAWRAWWTEYSKTDD